MRGGGGRYGSILSASFLLLLVIVCTVLDNVSLCMGQGLWGLAALPRPIARGSLVHMPRLDMLVLTGGFSSEDGGTLTVSAASP